MPPATPDKPVCLVNGQPILAALCSGRGQAKQASLMQPRDLSRVKEQYLRGRHVPMIVGDTNACQREYNQLHPQTIHSTFHPFSTKWSCAFVNVD